MKNASITLIVTGHKYIFFPQLHALTMKLSLKSIKISFNNLKK